MPTVVELPDITFNLVEISSWMNFNLHTELSTGWLTFYLVELSNWMIFNLAELYTRWLLT